MVVDFNDWLGLPKLLYEIAERYEAEGQYEQAKGICERIVSICPASRYGLYLELNLYSYCGNNPINWIDPYGLDFWDDVKDYFQEIFTWPWNVDDEAKRIQDEEYGDYRDPFQGDYRHYLGGGMLARNHGLIPSAIFLWFYHQYDPDPQDAAADWRGWGDAWLHPFTSLRELGKGRTVRPIGGKKSKEQ